MGLGTAPKPQDEWQGCPPELTQDVLHIWDFFTTFSGALTVLPPTLEQLVTALLPPCGWPIDVPPHDREGSLGGAPSSAPSLGT